MFVSSSKGSHVALSAVLLQILALSFHILRAEDLQIYVFVISLLGLRDELFVNIGYVCLSVRGRKFIVWLLH